jgi:Tat protein secretion system quality control protein TatD with DNase activity
MGHLTLCDAHCHPTDDPDSLDLIPKMQTSNLTLMATRLDDIDLVHNTAERYPDRVIPAFGYHPWFSHLVYLSDEPPQTAYEHYCKVLTPTPTEEFVKSELPIPTSFKEHLKKIKSYLEMHPHAILGEAGLDKAFRLPQKHGKKKLSPYKVDMGHQQEVFKRQLSIAVELGRPVSVHGVQCQNAVYECIMAQPPPSVCLHSYTGSPQFLQSNWFNKKHQKKKPLVFVSCSVLINIPTQAKMDALAESIPSDRILSESDYHAAGELMDRYVHQSLTSIASAYKLELDQAAITVSQNYSRFVNTNP